ncbi:MAG: hypothetical protein K0Q49_1747 [Haloplasmataceae bacterium]|jgi:hypothetical protein|nr:hypothetical protein [Haloplasmataceae bacterium]
MKVKLMEIHKCNIVKVCSRLGSIYGVWKSGDPVLNKEYYIEFTIHDKMILNKNLFKSNNYDFSIGMKDDLVIINGYMIHIMMAVLQLK